MSSGLLDDVEEGSIAAPFPVRCFAWFAMVHSHGAYHKNATREKKANFTIITIRRKSARNRQPDRLLVVVEQIDLRKGHQKGRAAIIDTAVFCFSDLRA